MSSSRVAPSDAILPPTPEPDEEEDCIDLTSDHEEASGGCLGVASQRHRGETASHPATARRSVPGSVLAQAPSPKLLMQQQLMRDFEVKKQQASGGGGSITAYLQPASTPAPQQISHDTIPSHQPSHHGKPRLQLSSITHTVPSQPAASFAPLHRQPPQPLMKTEPYSLFNQRSQGMKTESTYGSAAAASHTAAAASTPAAAAASPSHWQASQWQSQSQATPSFTPPANHLLSTQRPLPHSAPPSRNQRPPPAAPAAAASSHQPPQRPLATNTPAAAASSTSVYVPNAEEQLVARRTSLQDQLAELDDEEKVIANKRRGIKAELRKIEEELKKPMQLPYTQAVSNVPVLVIGGVSALISGSPHWAGAFPWDQAAMEMLQGVFGIQSYRISQREVINATMDRKDVFCVMPTGAGKSLLYQLPAMLNEGITLVISPLLSLMEDQVINLRAVGIESYMLSGTTSKEDAKHIHAEMLDKNSKMRLLYVTPEKIAKSKQFLSKLEKVYEMGKLVRICVDEVHCCSNWGHDFRPDYAKLNILKIQFPTVPILAVTATATDKVAQDCQGILSIRGCQFFKCSFNRPNLHFSVRHKSSVVKEVAADMYEYIRSIGHLDSSGIVYCYSKKETVELSSMLSALGLSCDFYHSDVSPEHKQRLHHRWVQNRVKIIVATNAFGLGINKPDVRFVLHHTFPAGISLYYQEGGRAGRDGLNAYCCLWYSPRDLSRQSIRVYAKQDMPTHLYPMVAYCHTQDQCRRVLMARHFGENFHQSQCGNMCDVCDALHPAASDDLTQPPVELPNIVTRDLSEAAVQVCEFVVNANIHGTEKGGGKRKRASKTVGTLTQLQLTDECRKRNSAIGLPKDLSREDCERLVMELLLQGILRETFKNTAYSTISYIQHDPDLLGALRRGDLLVKLTSVQAPNNAKSAKKPAKKRASKKGTKVEAGVEDDSESQQNAAASQYFPASSSSNQHLNYDDDDDFDIQEPEPEVELDEEAPDVQDDVGEDGDGMDYEGGGAAAASVKPERLKQEQKQDPQDSASQSSEDQPIMRKRLKKAAEVKREAKPSPAAASRSSDAPSRRPSFAPKHSQEDFMDDDDGDAYQAMLLESAQQQ